MKDCFAAFLLGAAICGTSADDFSNLTNGLGFTRTLAGVHQATTANPDGSAINFWTPSFEGATASETALSNPHIAGADAYGNVFIADKASHSILKITTNGLIHTFAGTHAAGFNGDGPDLATNLQIFSPNGLFVFPSGVVYLLDPGNHRIRRVDTNGLMTTIVNDPEPDWYPSGRALWVSDDEKLIYYTHEFRPLVVNGVTNLFADGAAIKKWTATDGIETVCSKDVGFRNPGNIAVNPVDGLLYVCDRAEDDTSKVAVGLFRIDGPDERTRITGNISQAAAADGQAALNSFIDQPRGIAFRPDGSYFLCGHRDGNVWFVDTEGLLHRYLHGRATGMVQPAARRDHRSGWQPTSGLRGQWFCLPREQHQSAHFSWRFAGATARDQWDIPELDGSLRAGLPRRTLLQSRADGLAATGRHWWKPFGRKDAVHRPGFGGTSAMLLQSSAGALIRADPPQAGWFRCS